MRIKIKFKNEDKTPKGVKQESVLGYVHSVLGRKNLYHGKCSNYNISHLVGDKIIDDNHNVIYPNGCCLYISSPDKDIMTKFLLNGMKHNVDNLKVESIEVEPIDVFSDFDIIRTLSPILVKKNDKQITFEDEDFINILREKSVKKLTHSGISQQDAETLQLELFHPENAKVQKRRIHNILNVGSHVMLLVKGKPNVRRTLYQLGLGYCTGCGFGFINTKSKR